GNAICTFSGQTSSFSTIASLAPASAGASAPSTISDCTINTCNRSNDTAGQPLVYIQCPKNPDQWDIFIHLDQKCTQVRDGQPLTCTYSDGHKLKKFKLTCDAGVVIGCKAQDPYFTQIRKNCGYLTPDSQPTSGYTCNIVDPNSQNKLLWVEKCPRPFAAGFNPHCEIDNTAGNFRLGTIDCNGAAASVKCTITDDMKNKMTVTCNSTKPFNLQSTDYNCTSAAPDC